MQFHSHCLKGVRIYLYNIGKKLFKTSTQDRKLFVGRGLPNGRRLKKKARKITKKTTTNAPTTSCVLDLKKNTTDYSSEELTWIQSNAVLLNENSTVLYAEPNVETGSLCTCCLNDKCATGQSCEATLGVIIAVVIITINVVVYYLWLLKQPWNQYFLGGVCLIIFLFIFLGLVFNKFFCLFF